MANAVKTDFQTQMDSQTRLQQLFKFTQLCRFYASGQCTRGSSCTFAHSLDSLKRTPNFSKTRLCNTFMRTGRCAAGAACSFAHGKREQKQSHEKCGRSKADMRNLKVMTMPEPMPTIPMEAAVAVAMQVQMQLGCLQVPSYQVPMPLSPGEVLPESTKKEVDMDAVSEVSTMEGIGMAESSPWQMLDEPFQSSFKDATGEAVFLQDAPEFWAAHVISVKNTFIDVEEGFPKTKHLQRCSSAPASLIRTRESTCLETPGACLLPQ